MIYMDFSDTNISEIYSTLCQVAGNSRAKKAKISEAMLHTIRHYNLGKGCLLHYCSAILTYFAFDPQYNSNNFYETSVDYEGNDIIGEVEDEGASEVLLEFEEDVVAVLSSIEPDYALKVITAVDDLADETAGKRELGRLTRSIKKEVSKDGYNYCQVLELIRLTGLNRALGYLRALVEARRQGVV